MIGKESWRMMFDIKEPIGYKHEKLDIVNAYNNSTLEEEIYIEIPELFQHMNMNTNGKVISFKKLYMS